MSVAITSTTATSGASGASIGTLDVSSGTTAIPAGTVLLFCTATSAAAGTATGLAATNQVTVTSGAINIEAVDAAAVRASTFDTVILRAIVTTEIPANQTFTVNFMSGRGRRNVVLVKISGIDNICEASSSKTTGGDGGTSIGPNGSSITPIASTTAATTTANSLVIMYGTYGGVQTTSANSPLIEIAQVKTSVGTSDRGIIVGYKEVTAAEIQSASTTISSSGGWAAGIATYPLSSPPPPPSPGPGVIIGGAKKAIASESVIIGGVKKTVLNKWVIVSGLKKPVPPTLGITVLSTFDFDAFSEGVNVTASGSWALNKTREMVAGAAAAVHGPMGGRLATGTSGYCQLTWTGANTGNQRVLSFYFTPRAISAITYLTAVIDSTLNVGNWRINADGTVTIRNGVTAVATSVIALNTTGATTYRAEWMIKSGTTGQELRIYEGESTTLLFALTGAMTTGTRDAFYVGFGASASTSAVDFDSVVIADNWTGPYATAPPPAISDLGITYPAYVSHRAMEPGPESTIDAYAASYALSPTSIVDCDLQLLADNSSLVVCHDTSIDILTSPDSPIQTGVVESDFTYTQWTNGSVLMGPTSPGHLPATTASMLGQFGPTGTVAPNTVMTWEVKTTSPYTTCLDIIDTLNVKELVLLQSFSITAAYTMASRGYCTAFVGGSTLPGADAGHPSCAEMATNNIKHLFLAKAVVTGTPSVVTDAHAAGLHIWVYTVNTTGERDTLLGLGVDGIVTDVPSLLNP